MRRPPPHIHGKEGVDGSNPSEGLKKPLQNGVFLRLLVACLGDSRSHQRSQGLGSGGIARDPLSSEEAVGAAGATVRHAEPGCGNVSWRLVSPPVQATRAFVAAEAGEE